MKKGLMKWLAGLLIVVTLVMAPASALAEKLAEGSLKHTEVSDKADDVEVKVEANAGHASAEAHANVGVFKERK